MSGRGEEQRNSVFGLALAVEAGLGLLALISGRVLGTRLFSPSGGYAAPLGAAAMSPAAALGLAAALPPLLAVYLMSRSNRPALRELLRVSRSFVADYLSPISLGAVVLLSAAAGFGEELLFRGLLQNWTASWLGTPGAVLATSLVFALLHAVTKAYAAYAFLLSLYLGALYLATGNILAPIVTHAVYDAVVLYRLSR